MQLLVCVEPCPNKQCSFEPVMCLVLVCVLERCMVSTYELVFFFMLRAYDQTADYSGAQTLGGGFALKLRWYVHCQSRGNWGGGGGGGGDVGRGGEL